jgi:transposase
MLDHHTRIAIVRLHGEGHGARTIAKVLGLSRNAVREVIRNGQTEVPSPARAEKAAPHLARIRALYTACKGNLVRVQEELTKENVQLSYSTLTAFCRRHEIGRRPHAPVGQYHFVPGEEMQHDTSPHRVAVAGRKRLLQCASLVLCYSRMVFVQAYPRFSRFECRLFLSQALTYFAGAAVRCMVDNTSVVRAHGTGKHMVPAYVPSSHERRVG